MFVLVVARQVAMYASVVVRNRLGQDFVRDARREAFRRFLSAKLEYHDRISGGQVINELANELNRAASLFVSAAELISALLLGVVYFGLLLVLSPLMTALSVVVLGLAGLLLVRPLRMVRPTGEAMTQANQSFSQFLFERVKSIRLIRLSGMEAHESDVLRNITAEQHGQFMRLLRIVTASGAAVEPIVIGIAMVLLYVSTAVLGLGFERILVFFLALMRLLPVMRQVLTSLQSLSSMMPSVDVILARMRELAAAVEHAHGNVLPSRQAAEIVFERVGYRYPDASQDALRDVSFKIAAGSVTAIVGPSGAGKSTLIDLIPALRRPQKGRVLINGRDVADYDVAALRAAIAYVPQTPVLFSGTPAEHIGYGAANADRAEIVKAAKLANADAFIRTMPQGYDSQLAEGGGGLSGGQRQRLELARALARQAGILVLDEPTSQLDANAEADFHSALRDIRETGQATVLVIAHRLAAIAYADDIVVIENGEITHRGDHSAMLAGDGWYRRAFELQHAADTV
ncbi:MAG: ABC transporter ATP-binding protein [Ferrovibrio sp.]|nr:ABC transporter ATP-binding protein [Ferrovibrio sp.]